MIQAADLKTLFHLGLYEKSVLDSQYDRDSPLLDDEICVMTLHSMNKLLSNTKTGTETQRHSIFGLKNALLIGLWQNRPEVFRFIGVERTPGRESACRHCIQGMSSLSHVCTSCEGTGKVRTPDRILADVCLGLSGQGFEWRMPYETAERFFGKAYYWDPSQKSGFLEDYQIAYIPRPTGLVEEESQFILWVLQNTKITLN